MKRIIRFLLLGFVLAITSTGCVYWHSTSALSHTRFPSSPEHPQIRSIAFNTEFQFVGEAMRKEVRQIEIDLINGWAEDIFKGSGRYDVTHDKRTADCRLFLDVRVLDNASMGLGILSGLTLEVIPWVGSESFEIEARLVKQDGSVIGLRTLSSKMNFVWQILLLPVTPFMYYRLAEHRMWREFLTELLAWTDAELNALQK